MDNLIKRLIDADISMNIVEFGGNPVTSYIMDMENRDKKIVTSSKMINSEYVCAAKYGLSLNEHIIPLTMGYDEVRARALETVFDEEYYASMGEENNTFMAVSIGPYTKAFVAFDIFHKYAEKARFYHFIIPKGPIILEGADRIIGKIGAAIALCQDREVDERWFVRGTRSLLKATKEYGSETITVDAG